MRGLPAIQYVDLNGYSDTRRSAIITNSQAEQVARPFLRELNSKTVLYATDATEAGVAKLLKEVDGHDVIYAVGGGMVTDVAKLVSYQTGIPLVCIPTIISTDAFLDDYTVIRKNGFVVFENASMPERVLIDCSLIRMSPKEYTVAGCGDILSIYTGLFDWKTTNTQGKQQENEVFSDSVYRTAQGILDYLIENAARIKAFSPEGIGVIVNCLVMEVVLCNSYGNMRPPIPEVGGEHFFTYCIEKRMPHFLHGEMIGLAVVITAFLQGQNHERILFFMDEVGLDYRPDGVSRKVIMETLEEMPLYVRKHSLRRSVYDDFDFKSNAGRLETLLNDIGVR